MMGLTSFHCALAAAAPLCWGGISGRPSPTISHLFTFFEPRPLVRTVVQMGGREGVRARESTHLTLQLKGVQGLRMLLRPRSAS